ncbi:hypothetical protein ABK040_003154 [Willaertia magna]
MPSKIPSILQKNSKKKQQKAIGHSLDQNRNVDKNRIGKGTNQLRSKSTIKRLLMYQSKVKRNDKGEIIKGYVTPKSQQIAKGDMARVQPDRKWFASTRTIGQSEMLKFRTAIEKYVHDPYSVLLKRSKVPLALLQANISEDPNVAHQIGDKFSKAQTTIKNRINYEETFGIKAQRKKPNMLGISDMEEYSKNILKKQENYQPLKDTQQIYVPNEYYYLHKEMGTGDEVTPEAMMVNKTFVKTKFFDSNAERGTSKRIWGELYKVVDSSDVLVIVLDARDPLGTRCYHVENYLKKEKPHKHVVFLLNKCDLVPTWVTVRWVKILSKEHPCLAFHASVTNPFGKGALIQLLRQYAQVHKEKPNISVGLIGYPNVGKSSVINTLRKKKVCKAAPVPGQTRVWQYVALMRKIFLIDCPGVVHDTDENNLNLTLKNNYVLNNKVDDNYVNRHNKIVNHLLKGILRAENVTEDDLYDVIKIVLERIKKEYIQRTYQILIWKDHYDFLSQLAVRSGKYYKNGSPDMSAVARKMIYDWQRGKIPWFQVPPFEDDIEGVELTNLNKELKELKKENPKSSKIANINQNIKQLFYKLKVNEDLEQLFTKFDMKGEGIIPEDKKDEIVSELKKPTKEQKKLLKKESEKAKKKLDEGKLDKKEDEDDSLENVDWDEVYANFQDDEIEDDDIEMEEDDNQEDEENMVEKEEEESTNMKDEDEEEEEKEEEPVVVVQPPKVYDSKPVQVKSLRNTLDMIRNRKKGSTSSSSTVSKSTTENKTESNVYIPKIVRNKMRVK